MKCTKLVLKRKSGLKVYQIESAGRKAGAKQCGGTFEVTDTLAYDRYDYQGYCDSPYGQFYGFEVKCRKCGTVIQSFDLEDLRQLVEKEIA